MKIVGPYLVFIQWGSAFMHIASTKQYQSFAEAHDAATRILEGRKKNYSGGAKPRAIVMRVSQVLEYPNDH